MNDDDEIHFHGKKSELRQMLLKFLTEKEEEPKEASAEYGGSIAEFLGADEPEGGDDWIVRGVIARGVRK